MTRIRKENRVKRLLRIVEGKQKSEWWPHRSSRKKPVICLLVAQSSPRNVAEERGPMGSTRAIAKTYTIINFDKTVFFH